MTIVSRLSVDLFISAVSPSVLAAVSADPETCSMNGSYGYLYNGNAYPASASGAVPLTETGVFRGDAQGGFSGEGALVFQCSDFQGKGPRFGFLFAKCGRTAR